MGNKRLWEALDERERLYDKGDDLTEDEGVRLGELEGVVAEENGYEAEAEAPSCCRGSGSTMRCSTVPCRELQGGLKVRVLLAQALFGDPEALLLDEPTNGLDMDSIIWLEDFLVDYNGVLVVISHDRRFLNSVCDHIADIDYETIITYPGNYDEMVRQKAQIRNRVEKDNRRRARRRSRSCRTSSPSSGPARGPARPGRGPSRSRSCGPRRSSGPTSQRPYIRFPSEPESGRDVLRIDNLSHAYGKHVIFEGLSRGRVAGREGGHAGPQRRRQDHPDQGSCSTRPTKTRGG